jgi:hypothetical protein
MFSTVKSSLASASSTPPFTFIFVANDRWDMFGKGLGVGHLRVERSGLQMILALARQPSNYSGKATLTVATQMRIRSLLSASITITSVAK